MMTLQERSVSSEEQAHMLEALNDKLWSSIRSIAEVADALQVLASREPDQMSLLYVYLNAGADLAHAEVLPVLRTLSTDMNLALFAVRGNV